VTLPKLTVTIISSRPSISGHQTLLKSCVNDEQSLTMKVEQGWITAVAADSRITDDISSVIVPTRSGADDDELGKLNQSTMKIKPKKKINGGSEREDQRSERDQRCD
jgi:hypothetical protein